MIAVDVVPLRVRRMEALSPTLRRLVLEPADGGLLPTSLPGAHLALSLVGRGRIFRNSYSIVSHHDERSRYEVIVRRTATSRGGSAFIHETLREGDVVSASAPNSQFPLQNLARKHLLIAGGIGITPFLSFLPALRQRGQRYELHQFAQPEDHDAFGRLLAPYASNDIHLHGGRAARGIVDILSRQRLGTHVYTCGPDRLMQAVQDAAAALGWPRDRVHLESFGAVGGVPFTIRLARTGGVISVGENDTMLAALEAAGVPAPSLCRGGACGQCLTPVIDGTPDHRDHFLTEAEKAGGRLVMPCVSRSKTPILSLDI